jgi:hypothetical protein
MSEKEKAHPTALGQQSGVNKEGEPFVQLLVTRNGKDEVVGQFSPEEVRQHALTLLEVAEAAEQDAYLTWFARQKIGLGSAAMLLRVRHPQR